MKMVRKVKHHIFKWQETWYLKVYDENGNLTIEQEWNEGVAIRDTTRLNNIFEDIKIDGYDVKPIIIDPNLD